MHRYGIIAAVSSVMALARIVAFAVGTRKAARKIHALLLKVPPFISSSLLILLLSLLLLRLSVSHLHVLVLVLQATLEATMHFHAITASGTFTTFFSQNML